MSQSETAPILICYDRSKGARLAIEQAAALLPSRRALVLTLWSYPGELAAFGYGATPVYSDDPQQKLDAEAAAAEGCELAHRAGLAAEPLTACASVDGLSHTILSIADQQEVGLIVLGARGLGGVRSLVLGSVSHGVVHHAHRPVLVVPVGTAQLDHDADAATAGTRSLS